jgi:hypothetical protein
MAWIGRLIAALLILFALPFHALVPGLQIAQNFNDFARDVLTGADPLVTAYADAGWPATLCLGVATVCLLASLVGVLKGERWAASLIVLAAIADALSLYFAQTMSLTDLGLSWLQIAGLGAAMIVLWLIVRGVTREV